MTYSTEENYSFINEKIDINNFIDSQIAEIYFANYDWPCNNFKMWKDNQPESKWQFLIYDLDLSFGYSSDSEYDTESMEHATSTENSWPHCPCSNFLLRSLLTNDSFKELFIARFSFHLSNTFCENRVISIINSFETLFEPEIQEHIDRWNYPSDVNDWENKVSILKEFARNRPEYMADNIQNFFNLSEFDYNCNSAINPIQNENILSIYPNPNNGQFSLKNISTRNIEEGKVTLTNTIGQVIYRQDNISIAKHKSFNFNFSKLSEGIYYLTLENNHKTSTHKVIITNDF